jgi:hypothetical protein
MRIEDNFVSLYKFVCGECGRGHDCDEMEKKECEGEERRERRERTRA